MKLIFTKHAQDAMVERGISRQMVEIVIKRGSKTKQTEGLLATYGYVRVAYYVEDDEYLIKTVMVEGAK